MRECDSGRLCSKLIRYAEICMKTCDVFSFDVVKAFAERMSRIVNCKFDVNFRVGRWVAVTSHQASGSQGSNENSRFLSQGKRLTTSTECGSNICEWRRCTRVARALRHCA